jgi:hypothetical protein
MALLIKRARLECIDRSVISLLREFLCIGLKTAFAGANIFEDRIAVIELMEFCMHYPDIIFPERSGCRVAETACDQSGATFLTAAC